MFISFVTSFTSKRFNFWMTAHVYHKSTLTCALPSTYMAFWVWIIFPNVHFFMNLKAWLWLESFSTFCTKGNESMFCLMMSVDFITVKGQMSTYTTLIGSSPSVDPWYIINLSRVHWNQENNHPYIKLNIYLKYNKLHSCY